MIIRQPRLAFSRHFQKNLHTTRLLLASSTTPAHSQQPQPSPTPPQSTQPPSPPINTDPYEAEIFRRAQYIRRNQPDTPLTAAQQQQLTPHRVSRISSFEKQQIQKRGLFWATLLSFVALPFVIYGYWVHRDQHMREKRERLKSEAAERYRRFA